MIFNDILYAQKSPVVSRELLVARDIMGYPAIPIFEWEAKEPLRVFVQAHDSIPSGNLT